MRNSIAHPASAPLLSREDRNVILAKIIGPSAAIDDTIFRSMGIPRRLIEGGNENEAVARHQQVEWRRMMKLRGNQ